MESELTNVPQWAVEAVAEMMANPCTKLDSPSIINHHARLIASHARADLDRLAERIVPQVIDGGDGFYWCRVKYVGRIPADEARAAELSRVRTLLAESIRHEPQPDMAEVREVLREAKKLYLLGANYEAASIGGKLERESKQHAEHITARIDALLAKLEGKR